MVDRGTNFTGLEALRENLTELELARRHERYLRLETESLLRGLRVLNEAQDTRQVFDNLVDVLRGLVPFEEIYLLSPGSRGGYRVARSSARRLLGVRWTADELLGRVLGGATVGIFDTLQVPQWQTLPPVLRIASRSAVLTPIRSEAVSLSVVFVHSRPAFFTPVHLHLIKRFSPLIAQALASTLARERLEAERNLAQAATAEKLKEIQERRRAEEKSKRVRNLMSSAIGFSPIYVWEIDADDRYTFVDGTLKVLGYAPAELIGRTAFGIFEESGGETQYIAEALARRQPFEGLVVRRRRKDGVLIWISISGSPVQDASGRYHGFRGVTMDVTEVTSANLKLEYMALHDALTGLANRRKFLTAFEAARARLERYGAPLSLLALDIDHFKRINDGFGHPAGDEVLVAIARRLEASVRRTDLSARFGGEEFMVLLPEADAAAAAEVAEKIRKGIADRPIRLETEDRVEDLKVTISIGVSTMTKAAPSSFDSLMERADQALYAAKMNGRNRVCLDERSAAKDGSVDAGFGA